MKREEEGRDGKREMRKERKGREMEGGGKGEERERERRVCPEREEALKTESAVFYSLIILEVTCHHFCSTSYKHQPCHNVREEDTSV